MNFYISYGLNPYSMDQTCLKSLDLINSEINVCSKELMFLRSGVTTQNYALITRLLGVVMGSHIKEIGTLNKVCEAFFGKGSDVYTLNMNAIPACIYIQAPAYGKYAGYTSCYIDAYVANTQHVMSTEAPQPRQSVVSFKISDSWKKEVFISSRDLVLILCENFLPNNKEKSTLLSSLKSHYAHLDTQAKEIKEAGRIERYIKEQTVERDHTHSITLFSENLRQMDEFKNFATAFHNLRQRDEFNRHISESEAISLCGTLLKDQI
jgi:hypothetical protein